MRWLAPWSNDSEASLITLPTSDEEPCGRSVELLRRPPEVGDAQMPAQQGAARDDGDMSKADVSQERE